MAYRYSQLKNGRKSTFLMTKKGQLITLMFVGSLLKLSTMTW